MAQDTELRELRLANEKSRLRAEIALNEATDTAGRVRVNSAGSGTGGGFIRGDGITGMTKPAAPQAMLISEYGVQTAFESLNQLDMILERLESRLSPCLGSEKVTMANGTDCPPTANFSSGLGDQIITIARRVSYAEARIAGMLDRLEL